MTVPKLHPGAARWLNRVLADPHLDETAKLVARAVALHMDANGKFSATDEEVAQWVAELEVG